MDKRVVRKNENILCEVIEGEGAILFNNITNETHILNMSATMIYELCDNTNIDKIFETFNSTFVEHDSDELYADFYETINTFITKNIVEIK